MIFVIIEMKMEIHVDMSSNAIVVKMNFVRHAVRNFFAMSVIANKCIAKNVESM